MKARHATLGATLLVVVLLTLLLMAVVLVTTMRLGLTTRQNTGDHKAILQAQYAAESQVSLGRSKFRDIQTILSATPGQPVHLKFPLEPNPTTLLDMEGMALQFCGKADNPSAWQDTQEFSRPRSGNDTDTYVLARTCQVDTPTTIASPAATRPEQFTVFSKAAQPAAYSALPGGEKPQPGADVNALNGWWQNFLVKATGNDLKYAVSPLRVVQLSAYRYRYYLGVTGVNAAGSSANARRYLSGNRTQTGDWWVELYVPSPFDYVNFMNKWPQVAGGWYKSVIDGNYFTNEKPRLYDYNAQMSFNGNMESVGCTAFPATPDSDCPGKLPGFFNPFTSQPTSGIPEFLDASFRRNATFSQGKSPNFAASYIPLPGNASNQQQAAQSLGLVAGANEVALQLLAGDENGNPLGSYDAGNQRWQEPSPTYQYIRFMNSTPDPTRWVPTTEFGYSNAPVANRTIQNGKYYLSALSVTREYRVDKQRNLYLNSGGTWTPTGTQFNGVIYSASSLAVSGPARLNDSQTGDVSKMPPALASFSQLNVVGAQGLSVTGDLTLSDTPCNNGQVQQDTCAKNTRDRMPKNVLGLFAPSGDVTLATSTPPNITLHAALMTSGGGLSIDAYKARPDQGMLNVIGSVINDVAQGTGELGYDGTFHGYNTNYSYDNRFRYGILPPYPPVVMFWRAKDAQGAGKSLDSVLWRQATASDF